MTRNSFFSIITLSFLISALFVIPVFTKSSGISGTTFPGTCAENMADVPKGDAPFDTSEGGKSYVTAEWYKNAIQDWKSSNLQKITLSN